MGGYQSGQMGQTVNLLAYAFGGSNPSPPTCKEDVLKNTSSLLIFLFTPSPSKKVFLVYTPALIE